jgi:predicted dehydrogenase
MEKKRLNVGMVGYAFMGRAHSHAWASVGRFFDLPLKPQMTALCGRDRDGVARAAERFGWQSTETDWRTLVQRPDIDVIDICTPGSTHADIALAALAAGKHVLCEKPLANSVAQAEAMTAAAADAAKRGVRAMVAFNYRRIPAVALAQRLIAEGRVGEVRELRFTYLQDWLIDSDFPMVWRLDRDEAGSGALGDIGAHIIDLSQHLLGDKLTAVSGLTATFVKERPVAAHNERKRAVTVDDAAMFLGRFQRGAIATFEATRFATGRKNSLRFEINGSKGSVAWDLERLNELQYFDANDPLDTQGFRRILVTESQHPWVSAWWPPGHTLGWEHSFAHELHDFIQAIAADTNPQPDFASGLQVQRVIDAVLSSAANARWETIRT